MSEVEDEYEVPVFSVFRGIGARVKYTYDFGDNWRHYIVLEKILPADPDVEYPVCTGGKRFCPPDDCGGVWGYYELLYAIRDPNYRHRQALALLGADFDPNAFSADDVNRKFALWRRRRDEQAPGESVGGE